jgi:hypothetical protein
MARIVMFICAAGMALAGALVANARVGDVAGSHATIFDYDAAVPLGLVLGGSSSSQGIVKQNLSFRATDSLRLSAYFVHPASRGPWPLVIWSPGAGGDRNQQLPDARAAAQEGLASLLIDAPKFSNCRNADTDLHAYVSYVVSRRRAIDLARKLPGVDSKRIAAAGFSQGADGATSRPTSRSSAPRSAPSNATRRWRRSASSTRCTGSDGLSVRPC